MGHFSDITLNMTQRIQRLPEAVVNQIAAGEVVENPASIVKELIENSLDAGARRIEIEIQGGGQQLIRVEDDGCGMSPEDALLCLERHATSKIRAMDDLQALSTMGFRGEALAAIASVSHFELKTGNAAEATRVMSEGGKVVSVGPCARNQGTTIEVRSLFFNVPARKKFQKSPFATTAQIRRIVETISLAHPDVAFTLVSQRNTLLKVPSNQDWKLRIEDVLEKHPLEICCSKDQMMIRGLVGGPEKTGPNRNGQYLFVNRRPIFSPLISRAVKEGFGTRIGESSHPSFVLFLELPPDKVDVNIHPQKREARFQDESKIFQFFEDAVSSVFEGPILAKPIDFTPPSFSFAEDPLPIFPQPFRTSSPSLPFSFPEKPIAVIGKFLLLEKEGMLLVDLGAAYARILFESMKKEKGEVQALIWPLEIPLSRSEAMDGDRISQELLKLGIESRLLGQILAIDTLPACMEAAHFSQFFTDWKSEKKLDSVACRFCRSLKKNYSLEEANLLWRRLQQCSDRKYDPLGNPIWSEIDESDLEKILGKT